MAKKAVATEAVATEAVATEAVKTVKGSATVSWNGGTRVYTKEVHGADFADLAKEFAQKRGGTVA
jgi:hypothetical protein